MYIYVIWAGDKMWPHLCPVISHELVTGYPTLDRSPTCVGDRRTSPSHGQASTTLQSTMAPRCYTSHATIQAKPMPNQDAPRLQATPLPKPSRCPRMPKPHHQATPCADNETGWSATFSGFKHSYQWSLSDQFSQVCNGTGDCLRGCVIVRHFARSGGWTH